MGGEPRVLATALSEALPVTFTVRDVGAILRVDRITVYRYMRQGRLRYVKILDTVRFPEAWLIEFLDPTITPDTKLPVAAGHHAVLSLVYERWGKGELLRPREAAPRMGVTLTSLYRYIALGQLPAIDISGGGGNATWRIWESALPEFPPTAVLPAGFPR